MKYTFALIFCLLFTAGLHAQTPTDSIPIILHNYFTILTEGERFNGNVLAVKDGKVLLDESYNIPGQSDSLRINKESKFIIASVSKIFVRYGINKLAEENKLSLNDKLSKFIPDFPQGDKITVQHLMAHQSGLPRELVNYESYDSLTLEQTIELAKQLTLQFEPGTQTFYSNVGFFILHYIISKASDEGYARFMREKVLEPLDMRNTGEYSNTEFIPGFAYGFDRVDGKITPVKAQYIGRFESGNLFSTAGDLLRFSEEILSGKALSKEAAFGMFTDSILQHAGGRPGYRSFFYKDLKNNLTFILLANYTAMPFENIVKDIPAIILGKPYTMPTAINRTEIEIDRSLLQRYTGKFSLVMDPTQYLITTVENGKLVMTDSEGGKTILMAESETKFFYDPHSDEEVRFEYDSVSGRYNLIIISGGLTLKTIRQE